MKKLSLKAIKQAFKEQYPYHRILAIKINDLAISIWMDGGNKFTDIKQIYWNFWANTGSEKMRKIKDKLGVGPYSFWHSCWAHEWIHPENR